MNKKDGNQVGVMADEAELRDCLQQLGAKRVEATLLAALVRRGAMGTQEIVDHTGLRQPEVSVGMRMLRDRDWVEAEAVPREGKGRPMHKYRLRAERGKVRAHYERMGRKSIEAYERAMKTLGDGLS